MMWAYDENDEETWSPEERDAKYLRDHPALESRLWEEWVGVVCGWEKMPPPNLAEWARLKSNFYSGKAPVDSVAELKRMRNERENSRTGY